jgi:hypothetical protein
MNPGIIGGANWGGSAFDAASGILYVKSSNQPALARIRAGAEANARPGETDASLAGSVGGARSCRFSRPVLPPVAGAVADCRSSSRRTVNSSPST